MAHNDYYKKLGAEIKVIKNNQQIGTLTAIFYDDELLRGCLISETEFDEDNFDIHIEFSDSKVDVKNININWPPYKKILCGQIYDFTYKNEIKETEIDRRGETYNPYSNRWSFL